MKDDKLYIKGGWHCCLCLHDIHDKAKQKQAVRESIEGKLDAKWIPNEVEDEDEDSDELDIMQQRQYGTRKSTRNKTQTQLLDTRSRPIRLTCVRQEVRTQKPTACNFPIFRHANLEIFLDFVTTIRNYF